MKTNESVILAHGWRKWYNGESYQRYSKKINNELVIICLDKDGNWILHNGYQYNIEMYIAIAEELKLLNIETANSKDKDSIYDLVEKVEYHLRHIKSDDPLFSLRSYYVFGMLTEIKNICKDKNV